MSENIDRIIRDILNSPAGPDAYIDVYDKYISGASAEEIIIEIFRKSEKMKNCRLMSAANIMYEHLMLERTRRRLDFCKDFMSQFWCASHQDTVGDLQKCGSPADVKFLEEIAISSLASWDERNDENQQFFRKCTWAIGEIDRRDFSGNEGLNALLRMAKLEPPIAAYWAKKQINRTLGERSPYAHQDLSEPPEVDYDWPSS